MNESVIVVESFKAKWSHSKQCGIIPNKVWNRSKQSEIIPSNVESFQATCSTHGIVPMFFNA